MGEVLTVANALTYARLVLLPVIVMGIASGQGWLTLAAMFLAWVTDLLDGRFARRLGHAGKFGKALDSTVDFVFLYVLFIAFYAAGRLATYQFLFLYLSMLTILSVQLFLTATGRSEEVASTRLGKLTGALEYAFLLLLVVIEVSPAPLLADLKFVFFTVLAAAIVLNSVECVQVMRRLGRESGTA